MSELSRKWRVIAVDIGGTSARFGAFSVEGVGTITREASTWVESARAARFSDLFRFVEEEGTLPFSSKDADFVAIAAAGPVREGLFCKLTNLPWEIDLVADSKVAGIARSALFNDLVAQAFATQSELGTRSQQICSGMAARGGTIAIVAPGTGLGKAALVADSSGRLIAMPSEGGHAQFVAENEEELRYAQFVARKSGLPHASWEEVLSGHGISTLAEFLCGDVLKPEEAAARFPTDEKLLEWSSRFLARACRNFALETLATGGVFVAGGIPAKNPILLTHPEFEREFRAPARHRELFANIPVRLITEQESGLWGGAYYAAQELRRAHPA